MDTVAVCDTEPIAMEGLRSLLESAEGLRVVAAENSLPEALDAARDLRPSILIVDKAFGVHAVMDWLEALRKAVPGALAIVWSAIFSEAEALRFLQAGASGVIRKTASLDEVLLCIRRVAAGSTWMEDSIFSGREPGMRMAHSPLTAREMQVMELVERGMKNKDIAGALGIRTGTVKIHLKHIFEKTGIRGRYGLALSVLKEKGLLAAGAIGPC